MNILKMTYDQIKEQIVALSRRGKTARARKLLKRALKKARNTREETCLLFIKALIANRTEHGYRSALRFYGKALRGVPRNLLFIAQVRRNHALRILGNDFPVYSYGSVTANNIPVFHRECWHPLQIFFSPNPLVERRWKQEVAACRFDKSISR